MRVKGVGLGRVLREDLVEDVAGKIEAMLLPPKIRPFEEELLARIGGNRRTWDGDRQQ